MSSPEVTALIRDLGLQPHPEGGYYRETYRAATQVPGERAASTLIYFLLAAGQISKLHRIDADESWHLYLGGPLEIHELDESSPDTARVTVLGTRFELGQTPQHVVPAGRWFAATLPAGAPYALVGCGVAPGFEFARFELAVRAQLLPRFPAARDLIERLT